MTDTTQDNLIFKSLIHIEIVFATQIPGYGWNSCAESRESRVETGECRQRRDQKTLAQVVPIAQIVVSDVCFVPSDHILFNNYFVHKTNYKNKKPNELYL